MESRQLLDRFVNTETFRIVREVGSATALASEIRAGQAYVGLQIPPHFTRDLRAGRPAQVQLLIDGSNSTTALQALNTAVAIALTQSTQMLLKKAAAARCRSRFARRCSTTRRCGAPIFLSQA